MASSVLRGTFVFVACVFFSTTNGQQGCSHDCFDYNRICPAVKNRAYYDEYVAEHKAGSLSHFSNAPIPPEPDCNEGYYKFGCPRSCGRCIPCETVDAAFVEGVYRQLEQKQTAMEAALQSQQQDLLMRMTEADAALESSLSARIDALEADLARIPVECNPCTEVKEQSANGRDVCKPKYDSMYVRMGECSCACGDGTQMMDKKCVAYEERNGQCVQVDTSVQNCPDGEPTKEESCSNGPCTVTRIVEKTSKKSNSQSKDTMRYVAVTDNGIKCQLGVVKQPNNKQRANGGTDTYDQADIESPACSKICMKKSEVFAYLEITISGTDGWKSDYVQVTMNGKSQKYSQPNFLDDRETLKYKKA